MRRESWSETFSARNPKRRWNAWFAIALFREGPFSWVKTHAYVPAEKRRGYPLASLEGFDHRPDVAWMSGWQGLRLPFHSSSDAQCQVDDATLQSGRTRWLQSTDGCRIEGPLAGRSSILEATEVASQPMPWSNVRGLLSYRSFSCNMRLRWGEETYDGVGLLEHAWGGYLPFPAGQVVPGSWQWDVLWEASARERTIYACLSSKVAGGLAYAPKIFVDRGGKVDELPGSAVEVGAYQDGAPTFWHGILGTEVYRAERTGQALVPFSRGAFFGFQFDLNGRRGIGFSERISSPYRPVLPQRRAMPAPYPAA